MWNLLLAHSITSSWTLMETHTEKCLWLSSKLMEKSSDNKHNPVWLEMMCYKVWNVFHRGKRARHLTAHYSVSVFTCHRVTSGLLRTLAPVRFSEANAIVRETKHRQWCIRAFRHYKRTLFCLSCWENYALKLNVIVPNNQHPCWSWNNIPVKQQSTNSIFNPTPKPMYNWC